MRSMISRLAVFLSIFLVCSTAAGESNVWQNLDQGLSLGRFKPPKKSHRSEYPVMVLKIDPTFYSFKLLSASEHGHCARTAKDWCKEFGLVAATNASMYQLKFSTKSTGYMTNFNHVNNVQMNRQFGAFMVFNPAEPTLPRVQIVDRYLQSNWNSVIKKYNTVVQNYRMIANGEKVGWPQQQKTYSTAAIGMDGDKNVLFIFCRVLYSTHDFIHILLELPIKIKSAMYVEGGPEASLYVQVGNKEMECTGSYKTGFMGDGKNKSAWPIPNVIGILKRK